MDAIQFDALTKAWIVETSRRRTLAGLLAGAIGALGLSDADDAVAAKSGRCRKQCGQCQFCKKGKCEKKDGKKRCKKGTCKPLELGTPCTGGAGNCGCVPAIEGDAFCAADAVVECGEGACASSGDCAAGRRCTRCGSSGETACFPECDAV